MGSITGISESQDRLVVYIQDLHCNYEAQKNIAGLIGRLVQTFGLQVVGVEGASQRVNVSHLADFPQPAVKERTADYLLRQGKITGPEYYAITGACPVRLEGIEDAELYQAEHRALARFLTDESLGYVCDLRDGLQALKARLDNPALQTLDASRQAFRTGKLGLLPYASGLLAQAGQQRLDPAGFPNLLAYLQGGSYLNEVDTDALLAELDQLDRALRANRYTAADQEHLDLLEHKLDVMERLLSISATAADLAEFRQERAGFHANEFLQCFREHGAPADDLEADPAELDNHLERAEEFYRMADERSRVFAQRLAERMGKAKIALLVTGGYHATDTQRALADLGIGCVSVKPRVGRQDIVNPYFALLKNRKTPLEKLLAQNQKILALRTGWPEGPSLAPNDRLLYPLADLLAGINTLIHGLSARDRGSDESLRDYYARCMSGTVSGNPGMRLTGLRQTGQRILAQFNSRLWAFIREGGSVRTAAAVTLDLERPVEVSAAPLDELQADQMLREPQRPTVLLPWLKANYLSLGLLILLAVSTFFTLVPGATALQQQLLQPVSAGVLQVKQNLMPLYQWYSSLLRDYPVASRVLTALGLVVLADFAAQRLDRKKYTARGWSRRRAAYMMLTSAVVNTWKYFTLDWLDTTFPGRDFYGSVLPKLFINRFLFSPLNFLFMTFMVLLFNELLRNRGIFWTRFRNAFSANLMFKIPFDILNFTYITPEFRVLAGNITNLFLEPALSAILHGRLAKTIRQWNAQWEGQAAVLTLTYDWHYLRSRAAVFFRQAGQLVARQPALKHPRAVIFAVVLLLYIFFGITLASGAASGLLPSPPDPAAIGQAVTGWLTDQLAHDPNGDKIYSLILSAFTVGGIIKIWPKLRYFTLAWKMDPKRQLRGLLLGLGASLALLLAFCHPAWALDHVASFLAINIIWNIVWSDSLERTIESRRLLWEDICPMIGARDALTTAKIVRNMVVDEKKVYIALYQLDKLLAKGDYSLGLAVRRNSDRETVYYNLFARAAAALNLKNWYQLPGEENEVNAATWLMGQARQKGWINDPAWNLFLRATQDYLALSRGQRPEQYPQEQVVLRRLLHRLIDLNWKEQGEALAAWSEKCKAMDAGSIGPEFAARLWESLTGTSWPAVKPSWLKRLSFLAVILLLVGLTGAATASGATAGLMIHPEGLTSVPANLPGQFFQALASGLALAASRPEWMVLALTGTVIDRRLFKGWLPRKKTPPPKETAAAPPDTTAPAKRAMEKIQPLVGSGQTPAAADASELLQSAAQLDEAKSELESLARAAAAASGWEADFQKAVQEHISLAEAELSRLNREINEQRPREWRRRFRALQERVRYPYFLHDRSLAALETEERSLRRELMTFDAAARNPTYQKFLTVKNAHDVPQLLDDLAGLQLPALRAEVEGYGPAQRLLFLAWYSKVAHEAPRRGLQVTAAWRMAWQASGVSRAVFELAGKAADDSASNRILALMAEAEQPGIDSEVYAEADAVCANLLDTGADIGQLLSKARDNLGLLLGEARPQPAADSAAKELLQALAAKPGTGGDMRVLTKHDEPLLEKFRFYSKNLRPPFGVHQAYLAQHARRHARDILGADHPLTSEDYQTLIAEVLTKADIWFIAYDDQGQAVYGFYEKGNNLLLKIGDGHFLTCFSLRPELRQDYFRRVRVVSATPAGRDYLQAQGFRFKIPALAPSKPSGPRPEVGRAGAILPPADEMEAKANYFLTPAEAEILQDQAFRIVQAFSRQQWQTIHAVLRNALGRHSEIGESLDEIKTHLKHMAVSKTAYQPWAAPAARSGPGRLAFKTADALRQAFVTQHWVGRWSGADAQAEALRRVQALQDLPAWMAERFPQHQIAAIGVGGSFINGYVSQPSDLDVLLVVREPGAYSGAEVAIDLNDHPLLPPGFAPHPRCLQVAMISESELAYDQINDARNSLVQTMRGSVLLVAGPEYWEEMPSPLNRLVKAQALWEDAKYWIKRTTPDKAVKRLQELNAILATIDADAVPGLKEWLRLPQTWAEGTARDLEELHAESQTNIERAQQKLLQQQRLLWVQNKLMALIYGQESELEAQPGQISRGDWEDAFRSRDLKPAAAAAAEAWPRVLAKLKEMSGLNPDAIRESLRRMAGEGVAGVREDAAWLDQAAAGMAAVAGRLTFTAPNLLEHPAIVKDRKNYLLGLSLPAQTPASPLAAKVRLALKRLGLPETRPTIVLTPEVLRMIDLLAAGPEEAGLLRAAYLFHEYCCPLLGHAQTRAAERLLFPQLYAEPYAREGRLREVLQAALSEAQPSRRTGLFAGFQTDLGSRAGRALLQPVNRVFQSFPAAQAAYLLLLNVVFRFTSGSPARRLSVQEINRIEFLNDLKLTRLPDIPAAIGRTGQVDFAAVEDQTTAGPRAWFLGALRERAQGKLTYALPAEVLAALQQAEADLRSGRAPALRSRAARVMAANMVDYQTRRRDRNIRSARAWPAWRSLPGNSRLAPWGRRVRAVLIRGLLATADLRLRSRPVLSSPMRARLRWQARRLDPMLYREERLRRQPARRHRREGNAFAGSA